MSKQGGYEQFQNEDETPNVEEQPRENGHEMRNVEQPPKNDDEMRNVEQPPKNDDEMRNEEQPPEYDDEMRNEEPPPEYTPHPVGGLITRSVDVYTVVAIQPQSRRPQTTPYRRPPPMPNDYFGFALFVTLFCFCPLGCMALKKSLEVKNHWADGDVPAARRAASESVTYSLVALCIGLPPVIGGIVVGLTYLG